MQMQEEYRLTFKRKMLQYKAELTFDNVQARKQNGIFLGGKQKFWGGKSTYLGTKCVKVC